MQHIAKICAYGLIAVLGLRMLASVLMHPLRIGWDPALHLQCAQLLVEGGLPYVDMFDVNPPLIWYLDTLPAMLATACHMPVTLSFNFFMVALMVLSAALAAHLVLSKLAPQERLVNLALVFGLLYFNFFLTYDFGQREEIFVLLYMPFLILRYCRYRGHSIGRKEAILIGLLGGMGICLKHYFLINAVLVELFLLLVYGPCKISLSSLKLIGGRLFTVETTAAVSFALLYLAHFLFLPQIVKDNYFGFLVPAFAKGYQFWDTSLASSLGAPDKRGVFLLLASGVLLVLPFVRRAGLLGVVAAFALSGVVPYLLQFKGWNYQDIPAYAGAVMLLCGGSAAVVAYLVIPLFGGQNEKQSRITDVVLLAALAITAGASLVNSQDELAVIKSEPNFALETIGYKGNSPKSDIDSPFVTIMLAHARAQDPVLFISNAVAPGFPPLTQLHMKPASRHLHCCILSVLQYIKDVREPSPENKRLVALEKRVVSEYISDIKKNKPVLIFIQNLPVADYLSPYNFDQVLKDYKKIDDVAGFSAYKLQVKP